MKAWARLFQIVAIFCLLCSCATKDARQQDLPSPAALNSGAGRGDWLLQPLHLEDGTELLFIVDTGAPLTYLDKSLEPRLGKPLGDHIAHGYYGTLPGHVWRAPKLFLGGTRLRTGPKVVTLDLQWLSDAINCVTDSKHRLMGILGMDCLGRYCIQLDFGDGKLRFLDHRDSKTTELGKAFPLILSPRPYVRENLLGMQDELTLIDSGCNIDGQLHMKLFQETKARWETYTSTNTSPCFTNKIETRFPAGQFGDDRYPDLHISGNNGDNTIGLRFLARHLVTLDFPGRKMYLKRISAAPLGQ